MSHELFCRCFVCVEEWNRDLTILGVLPGPPSPAEEREERTQEHSGRVVAPSLDGWGK